MAKVLPKWEGSHYMAKIALVAIAAAYLFGVVLGYAGSWSLTPMPRPNEAGVRPGPPVHTSFCPPLRQLVPVVKGLPTTLLGCLHPSAVPGCQHYLPVPDTRADADPFGFKLMTCNLVNLALTVSTPFLTIPLVPADVHSLLLQLQDGWQGHDGEERDYGEFRTATGIALGIVCPLSDAPFPLGSCPATPAPRVQRPRLLVASSSTHSQFTFGVISLILATVAYYLWHLLIVAVLLCCTGVLWCTAFVGYHLLTPDDIRDNQERGCDWGAAFVLATACWLFLIGCVLAFFVLKHRRTEVIAAFSPEPSGHVLTFSPDRQAAPLEITEVHPTNVCTRSFWAASVTPQPPDSSWPS
eukprot:gene5722-1020_t